MTEKYPTKNIAAKSNSRNQDQTFQAVGKQVERLALDENPLDEFQARAVPTEVIDSLCMNCGKDVSLHP